MRELIELFEDMGVIRWPMLGAALFLGYQIVRASLQAGGSEAAGGTMTRHAILGWGVLGALLGVLGTVVGLVVVARSVAVAGEVPPALLGGGLQVALTSTIFGLPVGGSDRGVAPAPDVQAGVRFPALSVTRTPSDSLNVD